MLFHFRVPRTRPWDKYLKKLCAFLDKNETTSHLSALFNKANELRTAVVKLLDECAKEGVIRADDLIELLESYLPSLELLHESVKACNVKLNGYLEIVWTAFLTMGVNKKSISYDMTWEKCMAYTVYGLAHYAKAQELHHKNRGDAKKIKDKEDENKEEFDPVFDDLPENDNKPKIYDDKNVIKEISQNLKKAGSIFYFVSKECFPVNIEQKIYDIIPESFRDVIMSLCNISLTNAQEFMVQLCVQTNKSKLLTSKLAMGISKKLTETHNLIKNNLGKSYDEIRLDYKLYLSIRSRLYLSIANKYMAQNYKEKEKYGEEVAYYKVSLNILNKTKGFPDKKELFTVTITVMQKSIQQQITAVKALLKDAESDNNNIYYEPVPKSVENPPSIFQIKCDEYKGYKDL